MLPRLLQNVFLGSSMYKNEVEVEFYIILRMNFFRDTMDWVRAIDLMRKLKPKILVPQHTRPIEGQEEIAEILTAYR